MTHPKSLIRILGTLNILLIATLLNVQAVRADFVPTVVGPTEESGLYRWSYSLELDANSQLAPGDFFTLYDFAGLQPGSETLPVDWRLVVSDLGINPDKILPTDDPLLPNLTFMYDGSPLVGPTFVGEFSALSSYNGNALLDFASLTTLADGIPMFVVTSSQGPTALGHVNQLPEPGSLLLFGLGLPVLGGYLSVRRSKMSQTKTSETSQTCAK